LPKIRENAKVSFFKVATKMSLLL